jgi:hypothetical protein
MPISRLVAQNVNAIISLSRSNLETTLDGSTWTLFLPSAQTTTLASNPKLNMNKKQAIKSRQANKASENVQQEIHAADILKGNKVTAQNTPAAARACKLNSLVSRLPSISCPFLGL